MYRSLGQKFLQKPNVHREYIKENARNDFISEIDSVCKYFYRADPRRYYYRPFLIAIYEQLHALTYYSASERKNPKGSL